jgi:hypothetical protein
MARPRQYSNAATRQAAYRARLAATTTLVDRAALDKLHAKLETLQETICEAAAHGDPFSRRCTAVSVDTMLDKLIAAFASL